jgi:hypothetical protein
MTQQARRRQNEKATAGAYPEPSEQSVFEHREFLASLAECPPALHFVGFKGDEYTSAVRAFGRPDFIHRKNDVRLVFGGEMGPHDRVIYANGSEKAVSLSAVDDSNIDVQAFEKAERKAGRARL